MTGRRAGLAAAITALVTLTACGRGHEAVAEAPAAVSTVEADQRFTQLAGRVIADYMRHHPATATDLGVHTYDAEMPDLSQAGIAAASRSLKDWRVQVAAVQPATLSLDRQLDREQLLHAIDAEILELDVIRPWEKDPDSYTGQVTNSAYVVMKRAYAPAADRLKALIARERKVPGLLADARRNLAAPPRIFTEIALEQIDGNINFFRADVPAAFAEVKDAALRSDFDASNRAVIDALRDFKRFLQQDLLPRSTGSFALGAETYRQALIANEMIDVPLDALLAKADADRERNEAAFQQVARTIDPHKTPAAVLAALQADHPPARELLATTQSTLDSLREFITTRGIVTIPDSPPAIVEETPPFMRSTTSASMDTPGPFEQAPLQAFYNMTLPDRRWPAAEQNDFMRQWYPAMIANVSVHEVYPGHYLQFLYAKSFPSDVRKVYGVSSNAEGWAHYCEQMMLDEGFHADDPRYRLAQLQDALLRDVRFIVGIRLHTAGMTVDEATRLFETAAHEPHTVAVSEAKRGAGDPLYGYYTMGKLMILKLRDDYKAKLGSDYSLKRFHNTFIRLGPLPIPLVRRAMLGEAGTLF